MGGFPNRLIVNEPAPFYLTCRAYIDAVCQPLALKETP
jgi:hypothetical protein